MASSLHCQWNNAPRFQRTLKSPSTQCRRDNVALRTIYIKNIDLKLSRYGQVVTYTQARNELETPRGAKSFLRGPKNLKLCLKHFSREGQKHF